MSKRKTFNLLAGIMAATATVSDQLDTRIVLDPVWSHHAPSPGRRFDRETRKERRRSKMRLRKLRGWR